MPFDSRLNKVSISRIEKGVIASRYFFELNPTTLPRKRSVDYIDLYAPGTPSGQAEFVKSQSESIDLSFMVTANSTQTKRLPDEGILQDLAEIESWTLPAFDPFLEDIFELAPPPTLLLTWGNRTWKCTCRSISIDEVLHNNALLPMIANVRCSLVAHFDSFEELGAYIVQLAEYRLGFR